MFGVRKKTPAINVAMRPIRTFTVQVVEVWPGGQR